MNRKATTTDAPRKALGSPRKARKPAPATELAAPPPVDLSAAREAARAKYLEILRERSWMESHTTAEITAAVRESLGAEADTARPSTWIKALQAVRLPCRRCCGTGSFVTMVENGQPKGPGGVCFRCQGKGWQNLSDTRRNQTHDRHWIARHAFG